MWVADSSVAMGQSYGHLSILEREEQPRLGTGREPAGEWSEMRKPGDGAFDLPVAPATTQFALVQGRETDLRQRGRNKAKS